MSESSAMKYMFVGGSAAINFHGQNMTEDIIPFVGRKICLVLVTCYIQNMTEDIIIFIRRTGCL